MISGADAPANIKLGRQVDARLQRQSALHREAAALSLHAIVDESVLQRTQGDGAVLNEQLKHLIEMCDHPQVTFQVMPFNTGPGRGHLGSFKWLGFPRPNDPGVVYVENQLGGLYLEEPEEIEQFNADFNHLSAEALSTHDSKGLLIDLLRGS
ncbi:DUF5753 domain-containing protein [Saccharopolyspora sp. 5N708]|uniref:DUF5753 domain-containing protein n=1 Tax=Saccharopolyspora sp. 5N708 TaxID=3457424 RepID=UPI003FD4A9B7